MTSSLAQSKVATIKIGDLEVRRLGFGAMRISGARNAEGVRDRAEAVRLCRRVYERGVNFIDTANIYGYGQSEEIIAEALYPYPPDLVITTKAGYRPGKIERGHVILPPVGDPSHITQECEKSLRRLKVDCIDIYQVHVPDPAFPYDDTVGAFVQLQQEGKIRHIGVSNVSVEQLAMARELCDVVLVENRYNTGERVSEDVLRICEQEGLAFLPWQPIVLEGTAAAAPAEAIALRLGASVQQVAIAWLLRHSPVIVPIPGTSSVAHLDENVDAAFVELTDADVAALDGAAA
ncbi:MAG: putative oxidoreductase [Acidimicrobiia bacterium]|nr:putative oxidoreductase [Acidimicrobiia bacterium]